MCSPAFADPWENKLQMAENVIRFQIKLFLFLWNNIVLSEICYVFFSSTHEKYI